MTAVARHRFIATACLLTAALLGSCGGEGKALPDQPQPGQPALSIGETPASLPVLPRPLDIPRAASAPPTDGDLYRPSQLYDTLLPRQRADGMMDLEFNPDWSLGGAATPERLAYAGYRFGNLTEYAGMERMKLDWVMEPADYGHVYLALADFQLNAWRWYRVPASNTVDLDHFDDAISGGGELLALVLLSGTDAATLRWIIVGDRLTLIPWLNTDLDYDPALNVAPLTVNFNGQGSRVIGGEVVAWDWDFEDDSAWDIEGDTDGLAEHYYDTPGPVTMRMQVTDDVDRQADLALDFWLVDQANVPPTAAFTMDVSSGAAPLTVQFDASTSTDDTGIRGFEWDMDNDTLYEYDTGTSPLLTHVFGNNGPSNVTLRVTDDDYATHTFTDTVTVSSGFKHVVVADGYSIAGAMSAGVCGTGVNQRACVAWQDYGEKDLKFSVATNIEGSAYAAPVDPSTSGDATGYSPALSFNALGYPMIAYGRRPPGLDYVLEYVPANTATGSSWDAPYTVNSADATGGDNALVKVMGVPCIASISKAGTQNQNNVYFYQAANNGGTSWNTGVKLLAEPADGMLRGISLVAALAGIIEIPVIGYVDDSFVVPADVLPTVVRATDQNGSAWNDPVVFEHHNVITTSLQVVAGNPALAAGSQASGGRLYYSRAGDNVGDTWPDGLTELAPASGGGYPDVALVNGMPAVCFFDYDGQDLWYIDAADATGTSWNEPFIVNSFGFVGEYCSMAVLGVGTPVIFYNDSGADRLMAAYWVP